MDTEDMDIVYSVEDVPIRLTRKRWFHIVFQQQNKSKTDCMAAINIQSIRHTVVQSVPLLLDFPTPKFWVDYDQEADVLYISSDRPQNATDSEMTEDGLLLRYRDGQLVGVTILDASTRSSLS
jgi:uncharacterized protein YuzE